MFTDFHPEDFNQEQYQKLSHLNQARFDAHCLYQYLYPQHVVPFLELDAFKKIQAPLNNQLISKNRQICLAEMEFVARNIYALIDAHLNVLLGIDVSLVDVFRFKTDMRSSLSDLADTLSVNVGMFLYLFHKEKFQIERPYTADLTHYYPSLIMDAGFDIQAGFARLYNFLLCARENTPTPVMISYRNDGRGRGAVFDHATFQYITGRDTVILTDGQLQLYINDMLKKPDQPILPYGIETFGYTRPLYLDELDSYTQNEGMIVVPGLAEIPPDRMTDIIRQQNQLRAVFEAQLVTAYSGKRIMLFICGGLYRLFETLGEKVVPVKGHQGPMPRFENGQLVDNMPAHLITINPTSKIARLMGFDPKAKNVALNVTSVHHKAAIHLSPQFLQKYNVVAKSGAVVEAVESKGSDPVTVGVQFHPESSFGHTPDQEKQKNLLIQLGNAADKLRQDNVKATRSKMLLNSYAGIEKVTEHSSIESKFDLLCEEDQRYINQEQGEEELDVDQDPDKFDEIETELAYKNCAIPTWKGLTTRSIAQDILERDTDYSDIFIPTLD